MKRNLAVTIGALLLGWWTVDAQMGRRALDRPMRFPARGMKGAVAAGTDAAADAGMRLFYLGGNAVDAGVSTMFAASMVEYSHFGFGGEAPGCAGDGVCPTGYGADAARDGVRRSAGAERRSEPSGSD